MFGRWCWMTLQFISNPNWRVSINQSPRVVTGQSLSHINDAVLIYSTSKSTAKAHSYSAVYSSNVFSIHFNNHVNTNVTLRNFILWSASQVNFFILQKDLSLKIGTYLHITAADQGGNFPKVLVDCKDNESLRFCCAHGYLEKMVGLPFEPFTHIVCLLAQSMKV